MNDSQVEGFLAGRESDVTATVLRWSPRMLGLALRYAPDEDEAHDIVQEAWILAFRRRRQFSRRGCFPAWLMTICRNVAVSRVRARGGKGTSQRCPSPDPSPGPEEQHDAALKRRAVLDAVLTLPERQRETVALRLLEGLSTRETADRLGCAEGTVKAALHAALKNLRPRLEEWIS